MKSWRSDNARIGTVIWWTLGICYTLISATHCLSSCIKSHFLKNGTCVLCPKECTTCVSETNCTECKENFFGTDCQSMCGANCAGQCHELYGHCTYGCAEGQFSTSNSTKCFLCPRNCSVCRSNAHCFVCAVGFYGRACDKRCAVGCDEVGCDKITGDCSRCDDGHFSNDGECLRCPDECTGCVDFGNCSKCQEGYLGPFGGQCFKQCPTERDPSNFTRHRMDVDCGLFVNETLTNISECVDLSSDDAFSCVTTGQCLRYISCLPDPACPLNGSVSDSETCGVFMHFNCAHVCRPCQNRCLDGDLVCVETCSVENTNDITITSTIKSLCLYSDIHISYDDIKEAGRRSSTECTKVRIHTSNTAKTDGNMSTIIIKTAIGFSVFCVCLLIIVKYYRARKSNTGSRCQQDKEQSPAAMTSNNMDDVPVQTGSVPVPIGSAFSLPEVHGYLSQDEYLALNDISDAHDYDYPMPDYVNCV